MHVRTLTAIAAGATLLLTPVAVAPAGATEAGIPASACEPLSSGQVDPDGRPRAVAAIAPTNQLVTGYCVTTASGATAYVELASPVTWVVVRGDGKGVVHYSYAWAESDGEGGVIEPPQDPGAPEPEPFPETSAPAISPWSWDWRYTAPTCEALTVAYPENLPEGFSKDVNIRFNSNLGRDTFNYHNDDSSWRGVTSFVYAQHPRYPTSGLRWYTVEWSSVHGTNHEWKGAVNCVVNADGSAETVDVPQEVTTISGFNASTVKVTRGKKLGADTVVLDATDVAGTVLQRRREGVWRTVDQVTTTDGTARVTFPKERSVGTYGYRLVAPGTDFVTGAVSKVLRVKVVKPKKKRRH